MGISSVRVHWKKAGVRRRHSTNIARWSTTVWARKRARFATLLQQMGRADEAKRLCADVFTQMRRAPKYVRKVQSEWIAAAERMPRA